MGGLVLFFKIGDNRAYANSDGEELEEEEPSEALDYSMPRDPWQDGGYGHQTTGRRITHT